MFEDDFNYDKSDSSGFYRGGLNKIYNHQDKIWYLYWINKNEYVIYVVKDGGVSGGEKIYLPDDYMISGVSQMSNFIVIFQRGHGALRK